MQIARNTHVTVNATILPRTVPVYLLKLTGTGTTISEVRLITVLEVEHCIFLVWFANNEYTVFVPLQCCIVDVSVSRL